MLPIYIYIYTIYDIDISTLKKKILKKPSTPIQCLGGNKRTQLHISDASLRRGVVIHFLFSFFLSSDVECI